MNQNNKNKPKADTDSCTAANKQPTVSSVGLGWEKLQFYHHKQKANAIEEHIQPHCVICINIGEPVMLEKHVDGKRQIFEAPTGDVCLYPPNTKQSFQWEGKAEFCQIVLEPLFLSDSLNEITSGKNICFGLQKQPQTDPVIVHLGLSLKSAIETCGADSKFYADSLAYALVSHLASQYVLSSGSPFLSEKPNGGLSQSQLSRVVDYIHAHYASDISLPDLANAVFLSQYHFSRLFKISTGLSPHQYLIKFRLKKAKQLLLENKVPAAEISQAVGFSSQSHLNHHLKRLYGVSPKELQQNKTATSC
jgi:AraC family transcriptional regulator